ncbi:acyltransferase family protein [Anaeromyxobacter sp. SG26]|uniref:acyltransferase family protein n=1 Tax=Anaeromyxobacter sp. SG26 TaxID=2925407 RepID=UPI001F58AA27|nr:acyltransferase [Anaeromyxobacter sp. SG26]
MRTARQIPDDRPTPLASVTVANTPSPRNVYLDGVRVVAIVLVMFHHVFGYGFAPRWTRYLGARGYFGVDLFFVLSGWLIGGQLLRGLRRHGRIDVVQFWGRRWLRTLPAYYAVLAVMAVAWQFKGMSLSTYVPSMVLFLQNYTGTWRPWSVTWSLCIEEHFYMVLPLVLLVVARRRRLAFVAAVGFLAVSPALRALAFDKLYNHADASTFDAYLDSYYMRTHMRIDGLVLGVLMAVARENAPAVWDWMRRYHLPLAVGGCAVMVASAWPWRFGWDDWMRAAMASSVGGFLGVSVGTAMLIPCAVTLPPLEHWAGRVVTWIAEHAYTLYLTHFVAFGAIYKATARVPIGPNLRVVLMFAGSGVVAYVLRLSVEKPGLRLRDWFEQRRRT